MTKERVLLSYLLDIKHRIICANVVVLCLKWAGRRFNGINLTWVEHSNVNYLSFACIHSVFWKRANFYLISNLIAKTFALKNFVRTHSHHIVESVYDYKVWILRNRHLPICVFEFTNGWLCCPRRVKYGTLGSLRYYVAYIGRVECRSFCHQGWDAIVLNFDQKVSIKHNARIAYMEDFEP